MVHSTNASIFPYAIFVELRIWDRDNDIGVHIYNLTCNILDVHTQRNENKMAMDTLYDIHNFGIDSIRIIDNWCSSISFCLLLPLYGLVCWIGVKLFRKYSKRIREKCKFGKVISFLVVASLLLVLKSFSVLWMCKEHGTMESERNDIIERRNYLVDKLVTTPQKVLNEMPSGIGTQFQGEWALYSCSMLSAALVNITQLYPETKEENLQ